MYLIFGSHEIGDACSQMLTRADGLRGHAKFKGSTHTRQAYSSFVFGLGNMKMLKKNMWARDVTLRSGIQMLEIILWASTDGCNLLVFSLSGLRVSEHRGGRCRVHDVPNQRASRHVGLEKGPAVPAHPYIIRQWMSAPRQAGTTEVQRLHLLGMA